MAQIDPKQEHTRLSALYASMSDLELQEIGGNLGELTEGARRALLEEMEKRGLEPPPPPKEREPDQPVILRRYRDMPAAYIEKSVLENASMECFLQDANVVRMDWFWSNALGGIKLIVREKDAQEAEKILNETTPIDPEEEDASQA